MIEAINIRTISDVPVGAFLSGGLDSSCIVNYAKEFNPDIDCFTIKSIDTLKNDGFVDDYPYALKVAKHLNVNFKGINVLEDEKLRQGIKDFTDWPTIPQLYVKGEFVGGCDIIKEMFEKGELKSLLQEKKLI